MTSHEPILPDERFWVRYSPHGELPVSGLTSFLTHAMVFFALLIGGFVIAWGRTPTMPVEAVEIGPDNPGGGGDPHGLAETRGRGALVEKVDNTDLKPEPLVPVVAAALPDVRMEPPPPELPESPNSDRYLDQSNDVKAKLGSIGKMRPGDGVPQNRGKGGSGSGGGDGSGAGPGSGAGEGAGSGTIRARRQKRWTMEFTTSSGEDYLRQLAALGAVLVIEDVTGQTKMYRRLRDRPVPAEPEDPQIIGDKMCWVDEDPSSLYQLATAMGVGGGFAAIRAFFPMELEAELLRKELAYRGRKEEQIHSTRFRIIQRGGRHEVIVVSQR